MTRLADKLLRCEASKKALQLLKQPMPKLDKGTPYERPYTPFFQDASEPSPDAVTVFISCDLRYGSFYDDADHWNRSESCAIPSVSFYGLLAKLETSNLVSMETSATIIETDMAWGADCKDPHETTSQKEELILVHIGISPDMKMVILKLLRQKGDRFIPYATLRQSERASL